MTNPAGAGKLIALPGRTRGRTNMAERAVRIRVHGSVQGVGYRAFLCAEGEAHGVSGWVRNRRDGTVEAEVSGTPAAIDGIIASARRGPAGGQVEQVEIAELPQKEGSAAPGMRVLPTE
jgi:acylphosphatase